jgi:DNA-binding response OmpR family regulator
MKRILILDDDLDTLDAIKEILTYSGFEVKTAPSGDDLDQLIAEYNPHLLLIDLLLRGKNGGDLCRKLKTSGKTTELKVILMSAYPGLSGSEEKYLCDDFVAKPFDMHVLIDKVNRHL